MGEKEAEERLNDYFFADDFKCKCGKPHESRMDELFIERLTEMYTDELRTRAWTITSAFRCIEYNKQIGGEGGSLHVAGRAVDIYCPDSKCRFELVSLATRWGFNGIGIGRNFVHLDDRAIDRAACWTYP